MDVYIPDGWNTELYIPAGWTAQNLQRVIHATWPTRLDHHIDEAQKIIAEIDAKISRLTKLRDEMKAFADLLERPLSFDI